MVNKTRLALALLLLVPPLLLTGGGSSGEGAGGVLLFEVQPFGAHEGVSLFNYGPTDVDLGGWSVTDGEGTLFFAEGLRIGPRERLTIAKSVDAEDWFSGRDGTVAFDDARITKKGSFILADAGDDVYLYRGETLIDAVCYGNKAADEGWAGDPVRLTSGRYLLRAGPADTDTSADWISTKPGLTNIAFDPGLRFDAVVTPFSFPESEGGPILKAIEGAQREVLISIYILTSVRLVALLCDLSAKGVRVCVLVEGNVLGYDISSELALMRSLVDAGGEAYLINDPASSNRRFSYLHNKYAVIDSGTVVVTSENWTSGNMGPDGQNRGWGAVIESAGLAEYVREVFLSDVCTAYGDVRPLLELYPAAKPYHSALTYTAGAYGEAESYAATVMPVLSPDNSAAALRALIDGAEARAYSQQLDLGSSLKTSAQTSPVGWMASAADRGVDARLILDSSANGGRNDGYVGVLNGSTGVKAISTEGGASFSLTHNKGLVVDDRAWVGSVNWTEGSFSNNRELAVVIDSPEVAAFFAALFIEDWGVNEHTVAERGLEVTLDVLSLNGAPVYTFTVSGPGQHAYAWDVLGDGVVRASEVNTIVCTGLPAGAHTLTVTMGGTPYSATLEYTAEAWGGGPSMDVLWAAGAAALMAAGCAWALFRRRDNNRVAP